jgi:uncharacterized lipoprotein
MMSMFRLKKLALLSTLVVAGVAVGGCKTLSSMHLPRWHKRDPAKTLCEDHSPYLQAKSVPNLKVGDGLTPPNTHNSIKIPDAAGETHAHTEKEGCLDSPPSFDSGSKSKAPLPVPAKPTHDAPGN